MKLLFYDKFFESLIMLPQKIQKKVLDFQKKFRENSKSAGIHLEPISTFKDSTLRTARVDQNYRAIIKAPKQGDVFYLLWVANHDDAYRWAENKIFNWNHETQSMQMFTAQEVDIPISKEKESDQSFFANFKKEDLLKIGVPELLLPTVLTINDVDDLDKAQDFIPEDVFENLYYLLDGADIKQIIFDIEEGKIESDNLESQLASFNNQRRFIELTDDEVFNSVLQGSLQKWKYYLHPSQRILVSKPFKGSVKVTGGAGTGKTVAALHRLKYLSQSLSKGSKKILFTTYTNALKENLLELVAGMNIDKSKMVLSTIDSVVFELIKKYDISKGGFRVFEYQANNKFNAVKNDMDLWEEVTSISSTSFTPEFLRDEYLQVLIQGNLKTIQEYFFTSRIGRGKALSRRLRKEVWHLCQSFKNLCVDQKLIYRHELYNVVYDHLREEQLHPFEHVIVDELQDFSNVELRLVRQLVAEKDDDLFLVGDPMQSIYNRQLVFSKLGIHIRGKRSKRLRINYRTTEEIKRLALSVITECKFQDFDGSEESKAGYLSLFHGKEPELQMFKTKNEELEYVVSQIDELKEDVLISEMAVCARTKNGLKDFRTALHIAEIPYSEKGKKQIGAINLMSFHGMKGLEFKVVFLVDVNDRTAPKLPFDFAELSDVEQEQITKSEKSLLYVAMTRAIEHVYITGTGRSSHLF